MASYVKLQSVVNIGYSTTAANGTRLCAIDLSNFAPGDTIAIFGYYRENGNANSATMNWYLYDDKNSRVIISGYEASNTWGGSRSINAVITKTNETTVTLMAYKQQNTSDVQRSATVGSNIVAIKIG